MSRISAGKLKAMLEQKLRDGPHRADIIGAYQDLTEARFLISRMKDQLLQMTIGIWYEKDAKALVADAVKFLHEEEDVG